MQQTTKYKLDLIEKTDAFSPDALNENTQEVEKQLSRLDSADAALDARVTALEVHKMVAGAYRGNSKPARFIELGFTPKAVMVQHQNGGNIGFMVEGNDVISGTSQEISIVEGGFTIGTATYHSPNYNSGSVYRFIAFA